MSDQDHQQPQPGHRPFPLLSAVRNMLQNTTQMPSTALRAPRTAPAGPSDPSDVSNTLDKLSVAEPAPATTSPAFEPSPIDAFVTRMLLQRGLDLPAEIVDSIIDNAEYWPHSTTEVDYCETQGRALVVCGGSAHENRFLFRCPPIGLCAVPRGGEASYEHHEVRPAPLAAEHPRDFFEEQVRGPRPELEHAVKKIVFTIKSRDQGWATDQPVSRGTYTYSWTWFEAGLERFDAGERFGRADSAHDDESSTLDVNALRSIYPTLATEPAPTDGNSTSEPVYKLDHALLPNGDHTVQLNKRAIGDPTEHRVEWSCMDRASHGGSSLTVDGRGRRACSGDFVRGLKIGDVVTLWAKARFPAWRNYVHGARVDIYWAV